MPEITSTAANSWPRSRDWYWRKADGTGFCASRASKVPADDAGMAAFAAARGFVTAWPVDGTGAQSDAALDEVLQPYGLQVDPIAALRAYAAAARYARETGGITVGTAPIATDRDSQALITGMWAAAQINPNIQVQFKSAGGGFATLVVGQIQAIASAVVAHVQACFTAESQVDAAITAGTITTTAQVDAAFAAVTT